MSTFEERPGWAGFYMPGEAPGALPNGTRIRKVNSEPGDSSPDGALGTVQSSVENTTDQFPGCRFAYFVEWDHMPRAFVGIMATKIEEVR